MHRSDGSGSSATMAIYLFAEMPGIGSDEDPTVGTPLFSPTLLQHASLQGDLNGGGGGGTAGSSPGLAGGGGGTVPALFIFASFFLI